MDAPPSRRSDENLDTTRRETIDMIDDGPHRTVFARAATAGLEFPRTFHHDRKRQATHASAAVQAKFQKVRIFK